MSDDATPRLALPYLAAGQAQKHVTLNESLAALDGLVQTAVQSRTAAAQPATPEDGDLYILPATPTGAAWASMAEGALVRFEADGWTVLPAGEGTLAYVRDEDRLVVRGEGGWTDAGLALKSLQNLERLGIGAAADATNPLVARLNRLLFDARPAAEGGDGDLRLALNKETPADVLSLLFQSAYAARAEIGLVGDDRLRLRVSADGAAFVDAVTIEADGKVGFGTTAPQARLDFGVAAGATVLTYYAAGVADQGIGTDLSGASYEMALFSGGTQDPHGRISLGRRRVDTGVYTERMVVDTGSGRVGINEAAPDYRLDVNGSFGFAPGASVTPADNGDVVFELTSDTAFTIKARGADGVVRTATLALA